ncbi:MAG: peptidoglycan-binding domain-containing protein [Rhodovibrionaceae bacterium]|nr:peptidoglycan-binding domain-containing protein [Rhodovibrionaceae bacterium]
MTGALYLREGLTLKRARQADGEEVRALQRDLRATGYLRRGIDGDFGPMTARAVRSFSYDLLHNDGSGGHDGAAPVAVTAYNRGRVSQVTDEVDQGLAACLAEMAADAAFPKLPESPDPRAANETARETIAGTVSTVAPVPWLTQMLRQESGLRHFNEPGAGDDDRFVVVGFDRNRRGVPEQVTSRGYGLGQFTLFHHPPRQEEVDAFIADPMGNLDTAIQEFREKFDRFVNGPTSGTRADDRIAEIGEGELRLCKYEQDDPRYMTDCRACAQEAERRTIEMGEPYYPGAAGRYRLTQYYRSPERYRDVPARAAIGCDWPYAARRYNGSGPNSYHYQTRILLRLAGREW